MATVFTKIIDGQLPGEFVWEDEVCVAFLSINPLREGHTLVVPREEVDHWIDADDDLLAHLMVVSRKIGQALQQAYSPTRVGQMIAGLEVPHLHIHLVPIEDVEDLNFSNAAAAVEDEVLGANADRIRGALRDAGHDQISSSPNNGHRRSATDPSGSGGT